MCQIDIDELPVWDEASKMEKYNQLRKEREEQLKKIELLKLKSIERKVCQKFNVSPDDIRNPTRLGAICIPRQLIMILGIERTKLHEYEIGNYFGFKRGRVHHAKKSIADLRDTDPKFRTKIEEIERIL